MAAFGADKLEDGIRKAVNNARDLIKEAQLLADHGSPRAYMLAQTATEELAKAAFLFGKLMQVLSGKQVKLGQHERQALRTHEDKLAISSVTLAFVLAQWQGATDLTGGTVEAIHQARNDSLYVGLDNTDQFYSPDMVISQEAARNHMQEAEHLWHACRYDVAATRLRSLKKKKPQIFEKLLQDFDTAFKESQEESQREGWGTGQQVYCARIESATATTPAGIRLFAAVVFRIPEIAPSDSTMIFRATSGVIPHLPA